MRSKAKNDNINNNNNNNKETTSEQARYDATESSNRKDKRKSIPETISWDDEETETEESILGQDGKNFERLIQFPPERPPRPPRQIRNKGKLVIKESVEASSAEATANADCFSSPLPFPVQRKKRSVTARRKKNIYYAPNIPRNDTGGSEPLEETNTCTLMAQPVGDLAIDSVSKSRSENQDSDKNGESKGKELPAAVIALLAPSDSSKCKRGRAKKGERKKSVLECQHNQNQDLNDDINSPKKRIPLEDLNLPTQIVIDPEDVYRQYPRPIWFLLVASNSKENWGTLPVLPPCYVQVKDVNMPVSAIKKYLVLKLGIAHEDELELRMRGELVHSDMAVQKLMEVWVQTSTRSEKAIVGDSAKDFVMVFTYGWNYDLF